MELSIFLSRAGRLASGLTSLVVAFSFLSFSLPSAAEQAQFTGLGSLFAGGSSFISDVSADGTAVVGVSSYFDPANPSNNQGAAFRWTLADGMVDIGRLGPAGSPVSPISVADGGSDVVGSAENNDGQNEIFRWTPFGGMTGLGLFFTPAGTSNVGGVIVGHDSGTGEAVRWSSATGTVGLGIPAGYSSSRAAGVSADGNAVAGELGMQKSDGTWVLVPFHWTEASGIVPFAGYPETDVVNRLAISPEGTAIVGSLAIRFGPETAFKWTLSGGLEFIPDAGGLDTAALGIAGDNATIVGFRRALGGANQATIWDASGNMRLLQDVLTADYGLDLTGWTLARATDISADGRTIVGNGINPLGFQEAWLVQLPTAVPVPAAVWLFGSGLLGLIGIARRKACGNTT